MNRAHYVYILLSEKDRKYYTGYTTNIDERVRKHNSGSVPSTKSRRPLKLIYFEAYLNKRDALGREVFLKSGSGHRYLRKQLRHFLEESILIK